MELRRDVIQWSLFAGILEEDKSSLNSYGFEEWYLTMDCYYGAFSFHFMSLLDGLYICGCFVSAIIAMPDLRP